MVYVKSAIKHAVASGLGWQVVARSRMPGCVVLMYHRIGLRDDIFPHLGADAFRCQVEWLAANCDVIGPDRLRDAVRRPSSARLPVLVTFDDGYRDYYETAYPILKRFRMPAVVFLATDYIDQQRLTWWDRLHLAVQQTSVERVELPWEPGQVVDLTAAAKGPFTRACKLYFKSIQDDVKERTLDALVLALGVDASAFEVDRQMMNWDEVRATMDLTTYGGHTHTHPLMSKIDTARLASEVRTCRDRIVEETGVRPTLFAYPSGDSNAEAKALLPRYGFDMAFSTEFGSNDNTADWLEMRRVPAGSTVSNTAWMMAKSWR